MKKYYLIAEFIFIFILVPTILAFFNMFDLFLFFLWGFGMFIFLILRKDKSFNQKKLWNFRSCNWQEIKLAMSRFIIFGSMLVVLAYIFEPEHFLKFPQEKPLIWMAVMVLYPILSVYPQEVIYRAFQFHRYKIFLGEGYKALFITSLTFSYVHIIFENWISIILTFFGGIIFSYSYKKTDSLLLTSIEHALYGCLIFTIGLGKYFFKGHVGIN